MCTRMCVGSTNVDDTNTRYQIAFFYISSYSEVLICFGIVAPRREKSARIKINMVVVASFARAWVTSLILIAVLQATMGCALTRLCNFLERFPVFFVLNDCTVNVRVEHIRVEHIQTNVGTNK